MLLDHAVVTSGLEKPVLFDEDVHISKLFDNSSQRQRFFENLQLSVPVDVIKFCPGGSVVTTFCISQVAKSRSEAEIFTNGSQLEQRIRPHLKKFNTRAQKNLFKKKIAKVQPSLFDFIYSELALDASAMNHPDMQQRLRMISLGESGLLVDIHHLNPGQPNNKYVFFQKLCELIEDIAAADDRRHGTGVAHMSQWISLSDMIEKQQGHVQRVHQYYLKV